MTKLFQVDAFTDKPFGGNPAAVAVLESAPDPVWMQSVAAEMNLSETAFVWPHEDPFKRAWRLRWFTPQVEVDLCGHGTLATAFVLWRQGYLRPDQSAIFETASGRLSAEYHPSGLITLNFPVKTPEPAPPPAELLAALGVDSATAIVRHRDDFLVALDSVAAVRAVAPDFAALAQVDARAVMVTAAVGPDDAEDAGVDFVSRFFAPKGGVDEDPATGAAHCLLTPYWAPLLGKTKMHAFQASARGATIRVELRDDRVFLSGHAVAIFEGTLLT